MTPAAVESLASILASVQERESSGQRCAHELRIAIARNYAVETMVPLLKHASYRAELEPEVIVGDYDNIAQEVLDPGSRLYAHRPDVVVISWILEHLDPRCAERGWDESSARESVLTVLRAVISHSTAVIAVNTFLPPAYVESGLLAGHRQDHRVARVHALNETLRQFAAEHAGQVFVIDVERLVRLVGEDQAIDQRFSYMYRSPFKKEFVARYAEHVVRIGRALKGRAKKCLVLDCDNTLWGGVVGEDGLAGIGLNPHEFPGRCFYAFQQSILNLVDQGVIVALCSKNNPDDVWEVLDTHPHSLLKRAHVAAARINWSPKSQNIAELARELNIGLDSMVFVDDSGVECELVKLALPDVTVLTAPAQAFNLPDLLYRDGLFDTLAISGEDRQRTAMYVAARERDDARASFATPDDYLASLQLSAIIHPAPADELARVAQLIGKTNQFNLTTRRHSEAQVRALAEADDSAVYSLTARDRFGDLGLVGVLIARREGEAGVVDTLLLSCRALGRKLELKFVHMVLDQLDQQWGVAEWRASYLPTAKNGQVQSFWDSIGFSRAAEQSGAIDYVLPAERRQQPDLTFITLR